VSYTDTIISTDLVPKQSATQKQVPKRLTIRDAVTIIKCVFSITSTFRGLIVLGALTGVIRAGIFVTYEWPMQTLADAFTDPKRAPPTPAEFPGFIVQILIMWVLCRWSHDYVFTTWHDWSRIKVEAKAKEALSLEVIDGLQRPETLVEANMQSSAQSSREQFPAIILSVMSDMSKVLLGIGFFFYFIYLSPTAPYFALAVVVGLCLSATMAYFTGDLNEQFNEKQKALDRFQKVENDVHHDIWRSRSGILFIFKNKIWRAQKKDIDLLSAALREYMEAYIAAGVSLMKRNLSRNFVFEVTRVISLGCAAWYACMGTLSFGTILVLNTYILASNEAIGLLSNLQKLLLDGRYFVEWFTKVTTTEDPTVQ